MKHLLPLLNVKRAEMRQVPASQKVAVRKHERSAMGLQNAIYVRDIGKESQVHAPPVCTAFECGLRIVSILQTVLTRFACLSVKLVPL